MNVGEYKGWIGLSPPAVYPSTMKKDNAFTCLPIPEHHARVHRNYPNPLGTPTLRIDK
jgi:hypothetical protein